MDGISVKLLSSDASDEAVVNAARVSFDGQGDDWHSIPEDYKNDPVKLINYLARHEHTSPFRHNSFTLRCKAPVFIARQLGKHQTGLSWNEVSRRYVDKDFEFHVPDEWRSRPEGSLKQGSGANAITNIDHGDIEISYDKFVDSAVVLYEDMIKNNVAPEQARMVLPQSMVVEWVWTGNLMSFAHLYNLRIKSNAQVECQEFAKELHKAIAHVMPISWTALTKQGE
jgi:thymidylate synthase (FAD)